MSVIIHVSCDFAKRYRPGISLLGEKVVQGGPPRLVVAAGLAVL